MFNWLTHYFEGSLQNCAALDLFAGSGALGFEAASRGAGPVVMVERNRVAVQALVTLRERVGASSIEVVEADAFAACMALSRAARRFDIVFLDPPFAGSRLSEILPLAVSLCTPNGVVYAESAEPVADADLAAAELESIRADRAGDVFYHLLRCKKQ